MVALSSPHLGIVLLMVLLCPVYMRKWCAPRVHCSLFGCLQVSHLLLHLLLLLFTVPPHSIHILTTHEAASTWAVLCEEIIEDLTIRRLSSVKRHRDSLRMIS